MLNAITTKSIIDKKETSLELINTLFNWDIIAKKTIQAIIKLQTINVTAKFKPE
jgi:hypothetical protein